VADLLEESCQEEAAGEEWLSIARVALKLSVSTWQVRKWLEAGQFDEIAVFSKRVTRISRPSFERFVARGLAR
jgi:hypothetical protein